MIDKEWEKCMMGYQSNRNQICTYLKNSYKFPVGISLYVSPVNDYDILFDMRGENGGITSQVVACMITPCTNLDGGIFKHFIKFSLDFLSKPLDYPTLKSLINDAVKEAQECKVEKH